jgi:uncharacterized protein YjbI with pentapeptide repeats
MKKIILITMLMSAVFAQSDCNTRNWQDYYNSDGKDMSGCDLVGADLRRADLTGADLTGANLAGAKLQWADLAGADLTGANLVGADLAGAKLGGNPDLAGAVLEGVKTRGSLSKYQKPLSLPDGWSVVDGTLINDEWGSSNPPDDMMTDGDDPKFDDIDTDSDGCISWEEFTEKSQKRN